MLYCFDSQLPFDYSKIEMALANKAGNSILYDSEQDIFTDFLGNRIDINGQKIFSRTGSVQIYKMNEAIIREGGIPIVSSEDINKITSWPKYYQTKRKMQMYLGSELINPETVEEIESVFGKNIFIKTSEKNFSSIIPTSLLKDKECIFYKALEYHLEDEFIISEPVNILKDHYGKKEYRCFVINNEPFNISRYTTEVFHQIEKPILGKIWEIIEEMIGIFPSCYVVDLIEYEHQGEKIIDVVEFNPIHSSGPFLYNSVLEKSDDILHTKNIKKIAKEFIPNIDDCSIEGSMISNNDNNLYEIPNGFSNDLRSIYLVGERGVLFAGDVNFSVECFAKKVTKPQFTLIESEEALFNKNRLDYELEKELNDSELGEKGIKYMQEQKLLKFYEDLVKLSQKDILMSHMFFEEVATSMLFGHEMQDSDLMTVRAYEMFLLWDITYINYCDESNNVDILFPFSDVDFDYYHSILNYYTSEGVLEFFKIRNIADITKDLENRENMAFWLIEKTHQDFLQAFNNFSNLKEIIRKGWINRSVKEEYCEGDATHSMQMFALASAYFRIYGREDLDILKVYEMIIIHEIGENLADDIVEGSKEHLNKKKIEAICVKETFKNLKSGEYFIALWEEFEARESKEARFAYMLDKLDPILKAKFLDKTLYRDDLFDDFYNYEERRETFKEHTNLNRLFYALKDK